MTPEQNNRWRKAVRLLDYFDFHAISPEGLAAFEKRLKADRGAPGWAIQARSYCITDGLAKSQLWVPEFALRSEIALLGLKILYPEKEDRIALYRRLLPEFLSRVLASLADDYPMLQELHKLLSAGEQSEPLLSEQRKLLSDKRFELSLRDTFHQPDPDPAQQYVLRIASECAELVRLAHFAAPLQWWGRGGLELAAKLIWCYEERIKFGGFSGSHLERLESLGTHLPVTDAFLATLEAECPSPDWLPHQTI
ncbi:MAG: hypothetical protein QM758_05920 [Armatimonas sp.]